MGAKSSCSNRLTQPLVSGAFSRGAAKACTMSASKCLISIRHWLSCKQVEPSCSTRHRARPPRAGVFFCTPRARTAYYLNSSSAKTMSKRPNKYATIHLRFAHGHHVTRRGVIGDEDDTGEAG